MKGYRVTENAKPHGGDRPLLVGIEETHNRKKYVVRRTFVDADRLMDTAVGCRARVLRRLRGWSRHALAKKSGVTTEDIELFERQPWAVQLYVVAAISSALGVEPCELTDSDPKTRIFRHSP